MIRKWWKESVVYQIYPRSFADSNGDGIGDLQGIIGKLDYLKDLGIDIVWLSPVYKSPNDDNGYDISDYQEIMAEFGTLADWQRLLDAMHARGLRLVMDLVVNHTSDEHPWFQESRSSKASPKRDWYIWRPASNGREPNNWRSFFGGSAWQWDATSGEYYLHLFSKKQPDLNWENPEVRRAVFDMMHWWLEKGVDGFRMDVITLISKVPDLPDAPITVPGRWQPAFQYFSHGPRLLEFLGEMKREVLAKYDVVAIGEDIASTPETGIALTHVADGPLDMLFQFEHVQLDHDPGQGKWEALPWDLRTLKRIMGRWQTELAGTGWNSLYLSNHDQPRPVSRYADDSCYRVRSAKLLATCLHTLGGTPFVYQGEEIGMTNVAFDGIGDYRDIETLNMYRERVIERGEDHGRIMAMIHAHSRDNARTPMQWDASPNAGFTTGTPWMRVNPNYHEINVADARTDPDSVFHHYKELIRLRHDNPVFAYGTYRPFLEEDPEIWAYTRSWQGDRLLVLLNFRGGRPTFRLPLEIDFDVAELLIANLPVERPEDIYEVTLEPYEARVYRLR